MSQYQSEQSSFDKNLRSFLEAVSMLEKEAGHVMDRLGFDTDSIGRVLDSLGSISAEAVRPLASVLGIADAAAVEALARDVRAMLHSEARLRREQASSAARLDELLAAIEALGTTTAGLADLQTRTQDRLDALGSRAEAIEATAGQRSRLLDDVEKLRKRIDELEERLAAELGLGVDAEPEGPPAGVKPSGARRAVSRAISSAAGSAKILEGLPTVDPKARPA